MSCSRALPRALLALRFFSTNRWDLGPDYPQAPLDLQEFENFSWTDTCATGDPPVGPTVAFQNRNTICPAGYPAEHQFTRALLRLRRCPPNHYVSAL